MYESLPWRYNAPFIQPWKIEESHIDHYQHVNNVAYLSQVEKLAWAHSNSLGLSFSDYQAHDRAMVIRRHELDYLQPAHLGDTLATATWIVACDGKLSLTRQFEFICPRREKVVFAAQTQFICASLSTGAPKRMPRPFVEIYGGACLDLT
ncbi:acyl-CoA thioesterase [Alteromonas sp. CYL-A6]|uniref:acyl-CoA thioesterase n=1 Tax=Alteromonas nitratireducens TaxID=3390813 RepID=UPI0034BB1409